MKRCLYGLLLLALAAPAFAQTQVQQGSTPAQAYMQPAPNAYTPMQTNLPATGYLQVPTTQNAVPYGYTVNPSCQSCQTCQSCQANCCAPMQRTCVAEPSVKTITHVCYFKACEEFCLPKCSCLFSCCNPCATCASCDGPHTKYYLVKRVFTEQCPTTKCVPAVAPACGCR